MNDRQIWKYVLRPGFGVEMPEDAEVLHAAAQGDDLCVWAIGTPDKRKVWRYFDVYGTGHPCPPVLGRYVGTAHLPGPLVFHVFEREAIESPTPSAEVHVVDLMDALEESIARAKAAAAAVAAEREATP